MKCARSELTGRKWPLVAAILLMTLALFPLLNVGRASGETPVVPRGVAYYVPITVTNAQNSPTPAPFQQMIRVSSLTFASYEAANLQNVEFFDSGGDIIPSWLESGNSNTALDTVYWLNLGTGISADSSVVVYMGFSPASTNDMNSVLTGEAPQLSSSYGQYDDGAAVFPILYQNFAATNCPLQWACSGVVLGSGASLPYPSYVVTKSDGYGDNTSQILDFYGSFPAATTENDSGFGFVSGASTSSVAWWEIDKALHENGDAFGLDGFSQSYAYTNLTASGAHVYSIYWPTSGSVYYSFDYGNQVSISASSTCSRAECRLPIGGASPRPQTTIGPFNWVRLRSYPPGGMMPSAAFGDVTPSDSVSVFCMPSAVVVGSVTACTATVEGIGSPTGSVSWGTSGNGTFSVASCSLSSGSCDTSYTPLDVVSSGSAPTITGTYGGDSGNPSNSGTFALLVLKANTTATVSCSPSEVRANTATACTASIVGFLPSGVVTWTSGEGGDFSPSPSCALSSGHCTVTYTASTQASQVAIIAAYAGDSNNEGSQGVFTLLPAQPPSASQSTLSTNASPAPTSPSTSPSSGGVPEFPFQSVMAPALVSLVVLAYAMIRRGSKQRDSRPGAS